MGQDAQVRDGGDPVCWDECRGSVVLLERDVLDGEVTADCKRGDYWGYRTMVVKLYAALFVDSLMGPCHRILSPLAAKSMEWTLSRAGIYSFKLQTVVYS